MKSFLFSLIFSFGFSSFGAAPVFQHLHCSVKGWDYQYFDLRQWDDAYYVQGTAPVDEKSSIQGKFEFMIPVSSCVQTSPSHLGVFTCEHKQKGQVVSQNKSFAYDSVKVEMSYQEEENTYAPLKEEWPIWYQRVARFTFSGGDFQVAHLSSLVINVNYNKPGDFREYCSIDGKLIPK